MIILSAYEPKILPVVPKLEWREPSVYMPKNVFGHKAWHTEFVITAKTKAGYTIWRGVFQDRDDADAFLFAAVRGTLRVEWALHDLPDPIYSPGFYPDELIVWHFAVTTFYTSGTSWTVPSDWNNSSNEIVAIGGGGNGAAGSYDVIMGKDTFPGYCGGGGGGAACAVITNQTYTPGASRVMSIAAAGADTTLRIDANTSNAIVAKGGAAGSVVAGGAGGTAAASTGSVKYSGGTGEDAVTNVSTGRGAGAASTTANGSMPTSGDGAGQGANGTGLGSGYGSGGGGAANSGTAGNYGAGGGGGLPNGGVAGLGSPGLLKVTHTPASAAMNKGFNIPNGW